MEIESTTASKGESECKKPRIIQQVSYHGTPIHRSSLYTKGAPAEILTVLKNPLTLVKNSPSTDKGTSKQGLCCRELGTRIIPCPMLRQPDLLSREVAAVHKGTMFYKTPLKKRKTRSTANLIPGKSIRTCVGRLRAFMELMWVRLTMGITLQDFV